MSVLNLFEKRLLDEWTYKTTINSLIRFGGKNSSLNVCKCYKLNDFIAIFLYDVLQIRNESKICYSIQGVSPCFILSKGNFLYISNGEELINYKLNTQEKIASIIISTYVPQILKIPLISIIDDSKNTKEFFLFYQDGTIINLDYDFDTSKFFVIGHFSFGTSIMDVITSKHHSVLMVATLKPPILETPINNLVKVPTKHQNPLLTLYRIVKHDPITDLNTNNLESIFQPFSQYSLDDLDQIESNMFVKFVKMRLSPCENYLAILVVFDTTQSITTKAISLFSLLHKMVNNMAQDSKNCLYGTMIHGQDPINLILIFKLPSFTLTSLRRYRYEEKVSTSQKQRFLAIDMDWYRCQETFVGDKNGKEHNRTENMIALLWSNGRLTIQDPGQERDPLNKYTYIETDNNYNVTFLGRGPFPVYNNPKFDPHSNVHTTNEDKTSDANIIYFMNDEFTGSNISNICYVKDDLLWVLEETKKPLNSKKHSYNDFQRTPNNPFAGLQDTIKFIFKAYSNTFMQVPMIFLQLMGYIEPDLIPCNVYQKLYAIESTTPQKLYERKIKAKLYDEALIFAEKYALETDHVYMDQWTHSLKTKTDCDNYLKKIGNKSWVIQQSLESLSSTFEDSIYTLKFGFKLVRRSREMDKQYVAQFQSQLFRLDMYKGMITLSNKEFNPEFWQFFRHTNIWLVLKGLAETMDNFEEFELICVTLKLAFQAYSMQYKKSIRPYILCLLWYLPPNFDTSIFTQILNYLVLDQTHNKIKTLEKMLIFAESLDIDSDILMGHEESINKPEVLFDQNTKVFGSLSHDQEGLNIDLSEFQLTHIREKDNIILHNFLLYRAFAIEKDTHLVENVSNLLTYGKEALDYQDYQLPIIIFRILDHIIYVCQPDFGDMNNLVTLKDLFKHKPEVICRNYVFPLLLRHSPTIDGESTELADTAVDYNCSKIIQNFKSFMIPLCQLYHQLDNAQNLIKVDKYPSKIINFIKLKIDEIMLIKMEVDVKCPIYISLMISCLSWLAEEGRIDAIYTLLQYLLSSNDSSSTMPTLKNNQKLTVISLFTSEPGQQIKDISARESDKIIITFISNAVDVLNFHAQSDQNCQIIVKTLKLLQTKLSKNESLNDVAKDLEAKITKMLDCIKILIILSKYEIRDLKLVTIYKLLVTNNSHSSKLQKNVGKNFVKTKPSDSSEFSTLLNNIILQCCRKTRNFPLAHTFEHWNILYKDLMAINDILFPIERHEGIPIIIQSLLKYLLNTVTIDEDIDNIDYVETYSTYSNIEIAKTLYDLHWQDTKLKLEKKTEIKSVEQNFLHDIRRLIFEIMDEYVNSATDCYQCNIDIARQIFQAFKKILLLSGSVTNNQEIDDSIILELKELNAFLKAISILRSQILEPLKLEVYSPVPLQLRLSAKKDINDMIKNHILALVLSHGESIFSSLYSDTFVSAIENIIQLLIPYSKANSIDPYLQKYGFKPLNIQFYTPDLIVFFEKNVLSLCYCKLYQCLAQNALTSNCSQNRSYDAAFDLCQRIKKLAFQEFYESKSELNCSTQNEDNLGEIESPLIEVFEREFQQFWQICYDVGIKYLPSSHGYDMMTFALSFCPKERINEIVMKLHDASTNQDMSAHYTQTHDESDDWINTQLEIMQKQLQGINMSFSSNHFKILQNDLLHLSLSLEHDIVNVINTMEYKSLKLFWKLLHSVSTQFLDLVPLIPQNFDTINMELYSNTGERITQKYYVVILLILFVKRNTDLTGSHSPLTLRFISILTTTIRTLTFNQNPEKNIETIYNMVNKALIGCKSPSLPILVEIILISLLSEHFDEFNIRELNLSNFSQNLSKLKPEYVIHIRELFNRLSTLENKNILTSITENIDMGRLETDKDYLTDTLHGLVLTKNSDTFEKALVLAKSHGVTDYISLYLDHISHLLTLNDLEFLENYKMIYNRCQHELFTGLSNQMKEKMVSSYQIAQNLWEKVVTLINPYQIFHIDLLVQLTLKLLNVKTNENDILPNDKALCQIEKYKKISEELKELLNICGINYKEPNSASVPQWFLFNIFIGDWDQFENIFTINNNDNIDHPIDLANESFENFIFNVINLWESRKSLFNETKTDKLYDILCHLCQSFDIHMLFRLHEIWIPHIFWFLMEKEYGDKRTLITEKDALKILNVCFKPLKSLILGANMHTKTNQDTESVINTTITNIFDSLFFAHSKSNMGNNSNGFLAYEYLTLVTRVSCAESFLAFVEGFISENVELLTKLKQRIYHLNSLNDNAFLLSSILVDDFSDNLNQYPHEYDLTKGNIQKLKTLVIKLIYDRIAVTQEHLFSSYLTLIYNNIKNQFINTIEKSTFQTLEDFLQEIIVNELKDLSKRCINEPKPNVEENLACFENLIEFIGQETEITSEDEIDKDSEFLTIYFPLIANLYFLNYKQSISERIKFLEIYHKVFPHLHNIDGNDEDQLLFVLSPYNTVLLRNYLKTVEFASLICENTDLIKNDHIIENLDEKTLQFKIVLPKKLDSEPNYFIINPSLFSPDNLDKIFEIFTNVLQIIIDNFDDYDDNNSKIIQNIWDIAKDYACKETEHSYKFWSVLTEKWILSLIHIKYNIIMSKKKTPTAIQIYEDNFFHLINFLEINNSPDAPNVRMQYMTFCAKLNSKNKKDTNLINEVFALCCNYYIIKIGINSTDKTSSKECHALAFEMMDKFYAEYPNLEYNLLDKTLVELLLSQKLLLAILRICSDNDYMNTISILSKLIKTEDRNKYLTNLRHCVDQLNALGLEDRAQIMMDLIENLSKSYSGENQEIDKIFNPVNAVKNIGIIAKSAGSALTRVSKKSSALFRHAKP